VSSPSKEKHKRNPSPTSTQRRKTEIPLSEKHSYCILPMWHRKKIVEENPKNGRSGTYRGWSPPPLPPLPRGPGDIVESMSVDFTGSRHHASGSMFWPTDQQNRSTVRKSLSLHSSSLLNKITTLGSEGNFGTHERHYALVNEQHSAPFVTGGDFVDREYYHPSESSGKYSENFPNYGRAKRDSDERGGQRSAGGLSDDIVKRVAVAGPGQSEHFGPGKSEHFSPGQSEHLYNNLENLTRQHGGPTQRTPKRQSSPDAQTSKRQYVYQLHGYPHPLRMGSIPSPPVPLRVMNQPITDHIRSKSMSEEGWKRTALTGRGAGQKTRHASQSSAETDGSGGGTLVGEGRNKSIDVIRLSKQQVCNIQFIYKSNLCLFICLSVNLCVYMRVDVFV